MITEDLPSLLICGFGTDSDIVQEIRPDALASIETYSYLGFEDASIGLTADSIQKFEHGPHARSKEIWAWVCIPFVDGLAENLVQYDCGIIGLFPRSIFEGFDDFIQISGGKSAKGC